MEHSLSSAEATDLSGELQAQVAAARKIRAANRLPRLRLSKEVSGRILTAIAGILVALLFAEAVARVVVCITRPPIYGNPEFDAKMRLAETPLPKGTPCIYFLGTSHSSRGIFSDLIASRLKEKGYPIEVRNLACGGSFPADELFVLEHALQKSPYLFSIIYECNQGGFAAQPNYAFGVGMGFQKSLYYKNLKSDWPILKKFDLWMKKNLYLVRYRTVLKERLTALPKMIFSPNPVVWNRKRVFSVQGEISPQGWAPVYPMHDEAQLQKSMAVRKAQVEFFNPKDGLNTNREKYFLLERVIEFAKFHQVPMTMLWLPLHPKMREAFTAQMNFTDEQLTKKFQRAAELDQVNLMDLHIYGKGQNFADGDHLNAVGAIDVSNQIADSLLANSKTYLEPLMAKKQ